MVNASATPTRSGDRRRRGREPAAAEATALGATKLNPFGDLHTLQHVSARLARSLRPVWEPLLRHEVRSFAEPLGVQRFADYRAERGEALAAWVPMAMDPAGGTAWLVLDGHFVLRLLDLFFGGTGSVPAIMPAEFSPAAEAMAMRIAGQIAGPLGAAWEPLTHASFTPRKPEIAANIDSDDAVIVTRFGVGVTAGAGKPEFVDIVYPVAALKPHGGPLTGKVLDKAEPDPKWRNGLTRAAMAVRFPVRSVLAEPIVPLTRLLELKEGDVLPITIAPDVPVMVGGDRLGCGTVGTSNGRAAIRLTSLALPQGSDQ
jgi:flagellar motor switch protein FliM